MKKLTLSVGLLMGVMSAKAQDTTAVFGTLLDSSMLQDVISVGQAT